MNLPPVKRNILLNPGPATTTDTVKYAQIVPDICPREKEFGAVMKELGTSLVQIAHGDPNVYTAVLFCGSGTLNIDVCVNSLVPEGKKILILDNGSYSSRAADVCRSYHIDHIDLKFSYTEPINVQKVITLLEQDTAHDIAVVYCCHHETGTGVLNPIRLIGKAAHDHGCTMIADTTSSFAMIPIDLRCDNVDFIMASAQKGIMAMTGLSFIIGNTQLIEQSKNYPTRSYYANLYMQYSFIRDKGEMHFTPPVQTIYAALQGVKEYFAEGETAKWERHQAVWRELSAGAGELGFKQLISPEHQSRLVLALLYPDDPHFDFETMHDLLYAEGFTIYPGKVSDFRTFRLCSLGAIYPEDIRRFWDAMKKTLQKMNVSTPILYKA